MALFAKLKIMNVTFNVVSTNVRYGRQHNNRMPTTKPQCESIIIKLIAPEHRNPFLYDWYAEENMYDGKIIYDLGGLLSFSPGETHEVEFQGAKCLSLKETYDIDDNINQRIITLEIVPQKVTIENVTI